MAIETIESKKVAPRSRFSLAFKKEVVAEYERGFLNKGQLPANKIISGGGFYKHVANIPFAV